MGGEWWERWSGGWVFSTVCFGEFVLSSLTGRLCYVFTPHEIELHRESRLFVTEQRLSARLVQQRAIQGVYF